MRVVAVAAEVAVAVVAAEAADQQPERITPPALSGGVFVATAFAKTTQAVPGGLGCLLGVGRIRVPEVGPRGGVVTQRSAKPFTPVQFWSWPPSI